jgi:L-asparaginase
MAKRINQYDSSRVVITHGTDTLLETGKFLTGRCPDKLVVLTGAMRPERFSNSDAPLNLGMAIAAVQCLPPGVYVAMHGRIKMAVEMQRDPITGSFF